MTKTVLRFCGAWMICLFAACAHPGKINELLLEPIPPALSAEYVFMPGTPDADKLRRENMINAYADVTGLEQYVSKLEELQRVHRKWSRAREIKLHKKYLDDARRRKENAEQGVPEGRRVVAVETTYRDDERGTIVVTRKVTLKDGTVETDEYTVKKQP